MVMDGRHQEHALAARRLIIYYLNNDGYARKDKHNPDDGDIQGVARKDSDTGSESAESERSRIPHKHGSGRNIE